MFYSVICLLSVVVCVLGFSRESITGFYAGYLEVCRKAAEDSFFLENFRSMTPYRIAFEIDEGEPFAQYIRNRWKYLQGDLEDFRMLDKMGNAPTENYEGLGLFSATTLRYIFHADQIKIHLNLPQGAKIVEIGAGFGGQAYVLRKFCPFSKYYIYDLPEVEELIAKVMTVLGVQNVHCLPIEVDLPEEKIDLFISNYAFSECDREMQLHYFEKVIKKAQRGYMIYNQLATIDCGVDSIPLGEFVSLLKEIGCKPKVFSEFFSGAGNSVILWDKTKDRKEGQK